MAKGGLWYPCLVCGKSVRHAPGPGDHVLDDGTTLFCPECGGATEVRFVGTVQAVRYVTPSRLTTASTVTAALVESDDDAAKQKRGNVPHTYC
jgi:hypothetical protein